MTPDGRTIVNDVFPRRLALFYAAVFGAYGLQMPFFPLWLAAKGLDAGEIGIVLAVPLFVRLLAIPLATRLADRFGALKAALAVASFGTAAGFALVGLSSGFATILMVFAFVIFFSAPLMPLGDAYGLKGLTERGRSYGPVRLWGSVAFIAANLGGGLMLGHVRPVDLIWPIALGFAVVTGASLLLVPLHGRAVPAPADAPMRHAHLRTPAFLAVAAAVSLVQASHAVYYGFSTLDWSAKGLDGTTIGALWALGVAAEIVLFALSARLPATLSPITLIVIGAAGATLRWATMALDPPVPLQAGLQVLHALSFGAVHLGTVQFVARMAPEGSRATVQGDVAVAISLATAGATLLAGALYGAWGVTAYAAMAALAALGVAFALLASRLGPG